jgi:hypothetical protein
MALRSNLALILRGQRYQFRDSGNFSSFGRHLESQALSEYNPTKSSGTTDDDGKY